jgi:hypothetical protein
MLARIVLGALMGASLIAPALAGQMNAEEARRFVSGKVFAFTCFDGTRGAGRITDDGGAAGSVQFSGSGPVRYMRLPGNTLQVRGQAICASLKGIPFEPCFNLNKTTEASFRGAVSGMGFAYCDFNHQGAAQMLMARANSRPRGPRSLAPPAATRQADASRTDVTSKIETPRVEAAKIEPVKPAEAPVAAAPATTEAVQGLRLSKD